MPSPAQLGHRATRGLLSLTHPSKELLLRQRALLRKAVPAGFPSAVDSHVERCISLDEHLIRQRETTFFMRVAGESMRDMGIYDGDLLVVDRAQPATDGSVIIAVVNGEFTVKQLVFTEHGKTLRAAHPDYPDIHIRRGEELSIWGVVQWSVHNLLQREAAHNQTGKN